VVNTAEDEAHQEAREAQVEGPPVFRCHRDNRPWTVATDGSAKGAVGFGVVAVEDKLEDLEEEDPDLICRFCGNVGEVGADNNTGELEGATRGLLYEGMYPGQAAMQLQYGWPATSSQPCGLWPCPSFACTCDTYWAT
jgi:hypothetical protein